VHVILGHQTVQPGGRSTGSPWWTGNGGDVDGGSEEVAVVVVLAVSVWSVRMGRASDGAGRCMAEWTERANFVPLSPGLSSCSRTLRPRCTFGWGLGAGG
jgi:hypothetical protein